MPEYWTTPKPPEYWTTPKPKKNKGSIGQAIFDVGPKQKTIINTNAKKGSKKNNGGLPIDSQGRIDLAQIAAQRLNFIDQYNQQMADINHNYQIQHQRMAENEPYVQRGILSDYAGRGMARSSGYGDATGRETQLYNQNLSDLAYAHTYGIQDLNTQRQDMRRSLATQQLAVRQAAADRMAAQAGTLGQGKPKSISKHRINRILGLHP